MPKLESFVTGSWTERRRLIRFRRQREHLRFSEELKLVPRGAVFAMITLLLIAEAIALSMCAHDVPEPWPIVQEFGMDPALLMTAGIVLGIWIVLSTVVFLTAYVYRDARRRGMNAALWTFIVLMMLPAYFAGYILYFTQREPLPYHCPKCGFLVSARYNYCSSCRFELHRTCGNCQREVGVADRFCPYCANDLTPSAAVEPGSMNLA